MQETENKAISDKQLFDAIGVLRKIPTCTVADALVKLKFRTSIRDIQLFGNTKGIHCGVAYTVMLMPADGRNKKLSSHYADDCPGESMVVVSSGFGLDNAVCGGLVAHRLSARKCMGLVTDGLVRDIEDLHPLAVFGMGKTVFGRSGALVTTAVQVPVVLKGVAIHPGDVLHGDVHGVVVIPKSVVLDVAELAKVLNKQDADIDNAVQRGIGLQQSINEFRIT